MRAWTLPNSPHIPKEAKYVDITEESPLYCGTAQGNTQLYSILLRNNSHQKMDLFIEFQWEFYLRYLDEMKEGEIPKEFEKISEFERGIYLQEDGVKYNFKDQRFQNWISKNSLWRNPANESEIDFAYRTMDTILDEIEYTAKDEFRGCGAGGKKSWRK